MQATSFLKEHGYVIAALIVLALYITPFYILGEDTPILVHDTHDSIFVWYKILADSGQMFSPMDATIHQVMNGIARNTFPSEFNVVQWLYLFFEPYAAYIINLTLMHFVAFIGMYLLLSRHILSNEDSKFIVVGVALAFALLPFNPFRGLGIAGMPLLLNAFLNILNNKWSIFDWGIIGLIPFYSPFTHTGFFVLVALSIFWLYDLIRARRPHYLFFLAICLLGLLYCLVEYRLIFSMFIDAGYVSHRMDFAQIAIDFGSALKTSVRNFFFGQYHSVSLHTYVIGPSVALAFIILLIKKKTCNPLVILVGLCAAISFFYGFIDSEFLLFLKEIPFFKGFNLGRFNSLHPFLWFIIFALTLRVIHSNLRYGKQIAVSFLIVQIVFLFTLPGFGSSLDIQHGGLRLLHSEEMTFNEYYSPKLFSEIDEAIALPKESYRVVSIGIHPAISQYNGFYTLDMYHYNYPLEYKRSFQEIMEKELDKSEKNKRYFGFRGSSRCYLYVSELEDNIAMNTRECSKPIQNLEIDSEALYDMGGRYIFSAVEILNYKDNNLELVDAFENDSSPWKIWVYSVKGNQ